jgi:hypothetical protein
MVLQGEPASFETALRASSDEDKLLMALRKDVILRSGKAGVSKDARR